MIIVTCLGLTGLAYPACAAPEPADESRARRVVHHFDFDERPENLEDVPKYWTPLRPGGFPHFAQGQFDFDIGHEAPPSFHLSSEGRSVAYHYSGPDARVEPNTSYLVEGYVRGDRLHFARTCLSAHFLDSDQNPLTATLVRSTYVGGPSDEDQWHKVEIYLPPAPPRARTIGLIAWVLQEPFWDTAARMKRYIPRNDVAGGAWFDDITIHALPWISLTTSAPGHVLTPDGPQEFLVTLADYADDTLRGHLSIFDDGGTLLESHEIPVSVGRKAEPIGIPLSHLPPGLYHAQLEVLAEQTKVDTRRLTFARLSELPQQPDSLARPFGVVVDPRWRSDPTTELNLLRNLAVRSLKLPVWTGLVEEPPTPQQRRATSRLLQDLVQEGFALTGVFFGPPSALIESAGAYPRPLVEVLSGDPTAWRGHLAAVVTPHAGVFRWWQLGPDDDPAIVEDDRLAKALEQLRQEMLPIINLPLLAVPGTTTLEPGATKLPAQQLALTVSHEIVPAYIPSQVELFEDLGFEHFSVYLQPLPHHAVTGFKPVPHYDRLARLADWAQRIILARHGGADTVFVPQTWQVRRNSAGPVTEPTEEYIVLRTIAALVSDATPGPRLRIAPGVEALVFHHDTTSVLAIWDPYAPPEGAAYAVQLGAATRQFDLWGRSAPLPRDEHGRQIVKLSSTPVFVTGIERWLIDFRTSVTLTPDKVEFGAMSVPYVIHMANHGSRSIAGRVRLTVPRMWEIVPDAFNISLMPAARQQTRLDLRFPYVEPAGQKRVQADVSLSTGQYYLEVPLFFELGLSDVEVHALPIIQGEYLIIRHTVTNKSNEVLHFRGSASVPGQARQYQPFANLRPGDTVVAEYRFRGVAELTGRNARLMLQELNDGNRLHNLDLLIP